MAISNSLQQRGTLAQTQSLTARQLLGVKLLHLSLPQLRAALYEEMANNPCVEGIESTLEKTTISERERESQRLDDASGGGDYPEEDFSPEFGTASVITRDEEVDERRQRFFDLQTKEETLEEHLTAQLPTSDIPERLLPLAEILIGELDERGMFVGSVADIMMVSGESEKEIDAVRHQIMQLDPPGCCAKTARECLLAQIDKLDHSPFQSDVRELIENHLEDIAAGNLAKILHATGMSLERYRDALEELRTLEPHPGRAYSHAGKSPTYVNPEVHFVKTADGWRACVDDRSLPDIHISPKYEKMLLSPRESPETKAYIRERIAKINNLLEAIENRQKTIELIAQAIIDAQPGFFENGLKGLRPLTMQQIADKVGVHYATVSRTVNDKYASTPKGTIELKKFFPHGIVADNGEQVTQDAVSSRIKELIEGEDKSKPLSDDLIARKLSAEGLTVARRTVAKYRLRLKIPGAAVRRSL